MKSAESSPGANRLVKGVEANCNPDGSPVRMKIIQSFSM